MFSSKTLEGAISLYFTRGGVHDMEDIGGASSFDEPSVVRDPIASRTLQIVQKVHIKTKAQKAQIPWSSDDDDAASFADILVRKNKITAPDLSLVLAMQ